VAPVRQKVPERDGKSRILQIQPMVAARFFIKGSHLKSALPAAGQIALHVRQEHRNTSRNPPARICRVIVFPPVAPRSTRGDWHIATAALGASP
jgi:hypothetical protein